MNKDSSFTNYDNFSVIKSVVKSDKSGGKVTKAAQKVCSFPGFSKS